MGAATRTPKTTYDLKNINVWLVFEPVQLSSSSHSSNELSILQKAQLAKAYSVDEIFYK